jgi:hypothetical protein
MRKKDVKIGGTYLAKVSQKKVLVQILRESPHGGWDARNEKTGRTVRIRTAGRLTIAQSHPVCDCCEHPTPQSLLFDRPGGHTQCHDCSIADTLLFGDY